MYDSSGWEDFAQALAEIEAQASPATLGVRLQPLLAPGEHVHHQARLPALLQLPRELRRRGLRGLGQPAHICGLVGCGSAAADAQYGNFGRIWTWASSICAAWPNGDSDRYTGPFNHNTSNPVLVIGNQFDPATRYQGAVIASNLLPNSRLLTVHGWGHTSLFISQCADAVQTRYLVDLTLPPVGTVCEQDHVPFTGP